MTNDASTPERATEADNFRARLAEAEETLHAIHNGELDAVVVNGGRGEQVYTLRGADHMYRQLIETMSEGAATLSRNRVVLYCNTRLALMLGRPLDQVLGADFRDYLPSADQSALDAVLAQVHTAPIHREINLKAGDGRLVPVYLSASCLPRAQTEMVFCLVLTDLTEQRSHEQIAAAAQHIRKLNRVYVMLRDVNQAIVRIREPQALFEEACRIAVEDGGLRMAWIGWVDRAGDKVLPVARAGVINGYLEKLDIPLGDAARGRGPTGSAVRTGKYEVCNDIENDPRMAPWREEALRNGYHSQATFPLKVSGEVRGTFALYATEPGFFDDDEVMLLDELSMDLGFAIEFTEREAARKRADEALRHSEERLRILFERALDVILLLEITPEGIPMIHDVNGAVFTILGYGRDELIGQSVFCIDATPNAITLAEKRRRDILAGTGGIFEVKHRCKDGAIRDFECSVTEMQIGSKTMAISVERDVTARKRAEEKIQSQLAELSRWQDVMLDREDRVQELKREINEFCRRVGDPIRYPSQEAGAAYAKLLEPKA